MIDAQPTPERYAPVILSNVHKAPEWNALDADLRDAIEVVARVLPFRTNRYVMEELIDWSKVPNDPIFQLTFPQRGMLADEHYERVKSLLENHRGETDVDLLVIGPSRETKLRLGPDFRVTRSQVLMAELDEVLGPQTSLSQAA